MCQDGILIAQEDLNDLLQSTLPLNFDSSTGAGFVARNIFLACFANLEFSKPADGKMN
jgi:hypothetical protein